MLEPIRSFATANHTPLVENSVGFGQRNLNKTAAPAMDYLSYLYTPQQMSGGASFGHSTRVGNWSEDYELQQHRIKVCAPVVDPLSGASCMFRGCGAVRGPVGRGLQRAHPRSSMISRCGVLSRFPQG